MDFPNGLIEKNPQQQFLWNSCSWIKSSELKNYMLSTSELNSLNSLELKTKEWYVLGVGRLGCLCWVLRKCQGKLPRLFTSPSQLNIPTKSSASPTFREGVMMRKTPWKNGICPLYAFSVLVNFLHLVANIRRKESHSKLNFLCCNSENNLFSHFFSI